jgi:hypothetical protein
MKKLVLLATIAFGAAMTHQAVACEWMHQATKTPVVVADGNCGGGKCATELTNDAIAKPIAQEPAGCSGASCAKPEPAPVTAAD